MEVQIVSDRRRAGYARRRMADFTARCRAGGLAVTPQRLAIIAALLGATDHPRAEKIFALVRKRHAHISLATVHRTLETLCRIGEARKVTMLHDSARYDGNLDPHHHVVCVHCRRVRDVDVRDAETSGLERLIGDHPALAGFRPLGWSLEIQALCDSCADKKAAAQNPSGRRAAATRRGEPRRAL
ncbi:MAG: transcriptional repressor [Candidatus Binataceae bacterium]|nr:transcriptional repressor [Candidatus Binataceae bacterium]